MTYSFKRASDAVPMIEVLKQSGSEKDLQELLAWCVEWTENDSKVNGWGVAPYYYEQLVLLYRKQKDEKKEIDVLKRFARQTRAPGKTEEKLMARLQRLQRARARGSGKKTTKR